MSKNNAITLSPEPCPYCAEHFELRQGHGSRQKHHVQSAECTRKRNADIQRQWSERQRKKQPKRENPRRKRFPMRIQTPKRWALSVAFTAGFRFLHEHFREDLEQQVSLLLLQHGINLTEPVELDANELRRDLRRELWRFSLDYGYTRLPDSHGPACQRMGELAEHATKNWATTWATCG